MKEILRSEDQFKLKLLQQLLEDKGIAAVIMDEHTGSLVHGIGGIVPRLMVLEEDFEKAVEVLKHAEGA